LVQDHLGEPVTLTINRAGEIFDIVATPRKERPKGEGPLGVQLTVRPDGVPTPRGPLESIALGLRSTANFIVLTLSTPILVLQGLISPELARPIGPPGMANITAQA